MRKEEIISTSNVRIYKVINFLIWISLLIGMIASYTNGFSTTKIDWFRSYIIIYWIVGFYVLFIKRTLRLKSVSFDDENLIIQDKNQDIIIPFVEIKDVKLRSIVGTHSVQLYRDLGFGKEFFFKSSLWYPLNFNRIDNKVFELQKKIDKAKALYREPTQNALGS